jgi:hypothetical protein
MSCGKKVRNLCVLAAVALAMTAATASADVVVYDHFDAVTLDTTTKWTVPGGGSALPTLSGSVATFNSAGADDSQAWSKTSFGYDDYTFKLGPTMPTQNCIFGLTNHANGDWRGIYVRSDIHGATDWEFSVTGSGGDSNVVVAAPAPNDVFTFRWSATHAQLWKNGSFVADTTTNLPTGIAASLYMCNYAGGSIGFDSVSIGTAPEPSVLILLAIGLFGLMAYAWRKRKCVPS